VLVEALECVSRSYTVRKEWRKEQCVAARKQGFKKWSLRVTKPRHWRWCRTKFDSDYCSVIVTCWVSQRRKKGWNVVGFFSNPISPQSPISPLISSPFSVSTAIVLMESPSRYISLFTLACPFHSISDSL